MYLRISCETSDSEGACDPGGSKSCLLAPPDIGGSLTAGAEGRGPVSPAGVTGPWCLRFVARRALELAPIALEVGTASDVDPEGVLEGGSRPPLPFDTLLGLEAEGRGQRGAGSLEGFAVERQEEPPG